MQEHDSTEALSLDAAEQNMNLQGCDSMCKTCAHLSKSKSQNGELGITFHH